MQIFYTPDIAVNPELPEEEAGHCIRVLRLTEGDEILLTDGKGFFIKRLSAVPIINIARFLSWKAGNNLHYGISSFILLLHLPKIWIGWNGLWRRLLRSGLMQSLV